MVIKDLAKWKYQKHKAQAKYRNIEFKFTFEEWVTWWASHGVNKYDDVKWEPKDRPCMCRFNDVGPYEKDNVYFATHAVNMSHRIGNHPGRPKGSKNKNKK